MTRTSVRLAIAGYVITAMLLASCRPTSGPATTLATNSISATTTSEESTAATTGAPTPSTTEPRPTTRTPTQTAALPSLTRTPEPTGSQKVSTVAFTRFTEDAWEERIWLIGTDGSGLKQLTVDSNVQEHFPRISPDGSKIAFGRCERGGTFHVYVMNPDGSGQVNISGLLGKDDMPAWSPDGKQIAFMSTRAYSSEQDSDIYVMAADGSKVKRLTFDPASDWVPTWSPDGSRIAFLSERDGKWKWWVMNSDGSNLRLLADIEIFDMSLNFPMVLLQGTWSRAFEGLFFTTLMTRDEQCVIGISVASGKRESITFADSLSLVEAPSGEVALTYFSNKSRTLDLATFSLVLTSGPEQDVAGSCGTLAGAAPAGATPLNHPVIDGKITPGEWEAAFKADVSVGTASGSSVPGTLYATHDGVNLYMAIRFAYAAISPGDSLTVHFDNDGAGGARAVGDDVVGVSAEFTDMYVSDVGTTPAIGVSIRPDFVDGGRVDGAGARASDGTYTTFELCHPLDSKDSHDFSLQPGNRFGFTVILAIGGVVTGFPSGLMIGTDQYIVLSIGSSSLERVR